VSATARPTVPLPGGRPTVPTPSPHAPVSLKAIALPVEHGGWGMLAEPLVMGLLLAPTLAGLGLAVAALGAFLVRHPLKLALSDWRRGTRYPRTVMATRVAAAYGLIALIGLVLAIWRAPAVAWLPVLIAAPLGLLQLWYDARLQGRQLLPELLGGVALGAGASALMLAGGWDLAPALAAWALLAAKAVASVVYIRARLRLDRDQPASRGPGLLAHVAALALAATLAVLGWGPWLGVAAFAILFARATHGLSPWHRRVRPQVVGFTELAYGTVTALLLWIGYAANV
jgi:YwiC-like protein